MQRPYGPPNQEDAATTGLKAASTVSLYDPYSSVCFDGNKKESYSTNNDGECPIVTFQGNHLNLLRNRWTSSTPADSRR